MCVWCGKSGYDFGIGKSEYSMRSRDVLMCSVRYEDDIPFLLPNTQLPPTRSDASKQSNGIPRSCRTLAPAIPDEPAPMTHAFGSSTACPALFERLAKDDTGVTLAHA